MNRTDLILLVKRIKEAKGTEEEIDAMVFELKSQVQYPNVLDLIFFDEKSPEEIVDLALSYKPIIL